jgi:hypothetical protein
LSDSPVNSDRQWCSRRRFLTRLSLAAGLPAWIHNFSWSEGLRVAQQPQAGARKNSAEGAIEFECSNSELTNGFNWAKSVALSYAHDDGPIGPWYEAALPGRNAFCTRDASHMTTGAHLLGLEQHNSNMLRQFALHVSASKKWATWWEITSDGVPAPVDYKSDSDFWYDLPANFDVLDACYRQWLWSRNPNYLEDEVFLKFYRTTVTDYVNEWDHNQDGLLEHHAGYGHRGIATYDEDLQSQVMVGADLIAAQFAAYRDYAAFQNKSSNAAVAKEFNRKAETLKSLFNAKWWDDSHGQFYRGLGEDGRFHLDLKVGTGGAALELPLYFGITEEGHKTQAALDRLERHVGLNSAAGMGVMGGVEGMSYLPNIFYGYGRSRSAYAVLTALVNPNLKRRTYPEISFSVVGNIGTGLMGIQPLASDNAIETFSQLTQETAWAEIRSVPIGARLVSVRHDGRERTRFQNQSGQQVAWRASFPGQRHVILVDGSAVQSQTETRRGGTTESWCTIAVPPGQTVIAELGTA